MKAATAGWLLLAAVWGGAARGAPADRAGEMPPIAAQTSAAVGDVLAQDGDLYFAPNGLYGYINGGAELYLEFGFVGLDVKHYRVEIAGKVHDLAVESYRMTDPAAALGIYLARKGRETPTAELAARHTVNSYQLLAVQGTLFLQVNNFGGDSACLPAMTTLAASHLASEPPVPPLGIWDLLPAAGRLPGSEFLLRGRFALQPIYTFGEGDVLLLEETGALAAGARYSGGPGGDVTRIAVVYGAAQDARRALANLRAQRDPYLEVVRADLQRLVLRDYAGKYSVICLVDWGLEITLSLAAAP
jgi:hypothetical protein